jgi:CubicO group peptidase (beta-lactamase class C family)
MILRVVLFSALIIIPQAGLLAQPFERARALIRRELTESGAPSIAVAVAQKGRILWEEGFGWADRENRRPATPHTPYSLASISKPITATALMLLVQEGKVRLDAPANEYLKPAALTAYVGDAKDATVRRVANHSAGLPLHVNFFYSDEPYRPPAMAETIRRYGILVTAPGEEYRYSNIGYGILDYLIAQASGKNYEDYLHEKVFVPLGLTHTSVPAEPDAVQQQAIRYGRDGLPIAFYDFDHRGASAVFACAHDLVRFGMFHLKAHLPDQKAILDDARIDEMQQPTISTGENSGYGIGWMTGERNGYRTVTHGGAMGGVRNLLLLIPAEGIAVAVLCNTGNNEIPSRVADAILPDLLPAWKARAGERAQSSTARGFKPAAGLAGVWKGRLRTHARELDMGLEIFESGDVHVQLGGQLKTLLNEAAFRDGRLTGRFTGDVGTEDASRRPHTINLALKLRGAILNGAATAVSTGGKRGGSALTSWLELTRQ